MNQRLEQFLAAENITQAAFADKINVARASVSHILSGRNKPGYDFFASLIRNYPALNIEWLITGKGKMYKFDGRQATASDDTTPEHPFPEPELFGTDIQDSGQRHAAAAEQSAEDEMQRKQDPDTDLEDILAAGAVHDESGRQRKAVRIIVFYDNGTFEEFGPRR